MLCWPRARRPSRRLLMQNVRYLFPFLALAAMSMALAACGSGGGGCKFAKDDIACVGQEHVTVGQLNTELELAKQSYKQSGQTFPKEGTTAYQSIKSQAITLLVQHAER